MEFLKMVTSVLVCSTIVAGILLFVVSRVMKFQEKKKNRDFADWAAKMEGDANVMAVRVPGYAERMISTRKMKAEIDSLLLELCESEAEAKRYLQTPLLAFGGRTPQSFIDEGKYDVVITKLKQAIGGVYN